MNIIEFLLEDHKRLLKDRIEIKKFLGDGLLMREKIKKYISDLELHETIERKFLISKLQKIPGGEKLRDLVLSYEKEHEEIWKFIDELTDSLNSKKFELVQQKFFNFFAFVEQHVSKEERLFFPTVQKLIDSKTLKEMGKKAENFYEHNRQTNNK